MTVTLTNVDGLSVEELNQIFAEACEAHQQGKLEEAQGKYTRLLKRFGQAPVLRYNLGLVCYEQGDYEGALRNFERGVELAPDDVDLQFNLALTRRRQGDVAGAIAGYQQVLEFVPESVDALYNLGGCYRERGEFDEAVACYERVLTLKSDHLAANNTLAYLYHRAGEKELAVHHYREVLKKEPGHNGAAYMLAALKGGSRVGSPPEGYVSEVFDNYAAHFEENLVGQLEYRVPTQLRDLLHQQLGEEVSFSQGLDLGCGTGLAGEAFAGKVACLAGVDISHKMVGIAREKGIYESLTVADIECFLEQTREQYEFFVACDVFNYLGRLERAFQGVASVAAPGALLCFSTEQYDGDGFRLQETGRFAHNPKYIHSLCRKAGFQILREEKVSLRRERGCWVAGTLWVTLIV